MIPAVFLLAAMTMLPESPRWLARQDCWEDCHDVLALVHGKGDRNSAFVALELEDIKQMCEFERRHANVTYLDLFKPNMLNRTFIGIFTQIWSQLTGMNVMSKSFIELSGHRQDRDTNAPLVYYIAYVFGMAGYTGNANLLASSIQYVINVLMTIPALL